MEREVNMKLVARIFFAAMLVTGFIGGMQAQQSAQKKIFVAVLDFDARAGISPGEAASLSDIFSSQLSQTGKFILVERNGIKRILTEQGFQQSEACSSVECIAEVGKILKVEKIFSGTIGKIGKLYNINIQLINVSTAQIEANKNRQHEGEIEDLATTIIPEMAVEMTQSLTGQRVEITESYSSSSAYNRHEIEVGVGSGPESKAPVFKSIPIAPRLAELVHVKPQGVFHLAYRFSFNPYFSLGLRMTALKQQIDNVPVLQYLNATSTIAPTGAQQSIKINCNTLSLEGRVNFIRGSVEPYGALSLGLAFGNISGSGSNGFLDQRNFDGPAFGFGVGSKFHITNRFGATLDFRVLGISAGYKEDSPRAYLFNSEKFDGSYSAAFLILFYQF